MEYNYKQSEKKEFCNHLNEQIQDLDQMIEETQKQIE